VLRPWDCLAIATTGLMHNHVRAMRASVCVCE
jgi:deoxyribodipyrimidine photolyase